MRKSEIFAGILADVSTETEIEPELILSDSRVEEVVDARYLVIFLLLGNGFYCRMIAERMGMTHRAVFNATSTSAVAVLQNQVATLLSLTKMVVPATSVCPQPMPLHNSWTAPTATPSTGA